MRASGPLMLAVLMTAFLFPLRAQKYQPMLGDSSHWTVVTEFFGYKTDGYFANEDTVMNGKTYKFINGFHFNKNVFLREDTTTRQVFYRQKSGYKANQDVLIYDFSLQVGDSMLLYNPNTTLPDSVGYFVVDSITMTAVLTGSRRTWHLSKSDGSRRAMWLEGIGSTTLVNSSSGIGDATSIPQLTCFHRDEEHVYQSALSVSFASCEINTVGVMTTKEKNKLSVVLGPNPVSDVLNLEIHGSQNVINIRLYNSQGQLMHETTSSGKDKRTLDVNTLPPGLYLIHFSENDDRLTREFLKK